MKKLNLRVSSMIIAAFVSVAILGSCKKECTTCVPQEPDLKEEILFNLMNKTVGSEFGIFKFHIDEYYRETATCKPNEKLFQFFKEYCLSQNIPIDKHVYTFVLYYDLPISKSLSVTSENIKGISIYDIEEKKMEHRLYIRNMDLVFEEVENVRVAVPYVSPTHIHFYLDNYVFTDCQNRSSIYLIGNYSIEVEKNLKKYKTAIRYEIEKVHSAIENTKKAQSGSGHCGGQAECPYGPSQPCIGAGGNFGCSDDLCWARETSVQLRQANMAQYLFFDMDLMYSFRDNFLYKSKKGEEYIGNYYYLSEEYQKNIKRVLAFH